MIQKLQDFLHADAELVADVLAEVRDVRVAALGVERDGLRLLRTSLELDRGDIPAAAVRFEGGQDAAGSIEMFMMQPVCHPKIAA